MPPKRQGPVPRSELLFLDHRYSGVGAALVIDNDELGTGNDNAHDLSRMVSGDDGPMGGIHRRDRVGTGLIAGLEGG